MNASALSGLVAGGARFITGVQVTWLDGLPGPGQAIYFANHTSHLDFVVLWSSLPREARARTRPAAAADYWSRGLRRKLAVDVFNAILVSRHEHNGEPGTVETAARETIEHIAREMSDRYSLIIFPEGTRGTGEAIAPFKSGLYYLCLQKPGVALVPAYIENLNRILPKGEFLPVPFISRIRFGKPMFLDPAESKREFLERARDAVCRLRPA
jgi:1-acyl-sn-glycerol-3-phosphate acyltransferase